MSSLLFQLSNMDAVLNAFGSSILQCCDTEMSRPHYLGLLEFFVTHWEEIFLVPASFREEVKSRLEGQKYTAAVPVPSEFCLNFQFQCRSICGSFKNDFFKASHIVHGLAPLTSVVKES